MLFKLHLDILIIFVNIDIKKGEKLIALTLFNSFLISRWRKVKIVKTLFLSSLFKLMPSTWKKRLQVLCIQEKMSDVQRKSKMADMSKKNFSMSKSYFHEITNV